MTYKYPYISDKNMYAAVMGACKYIRETGYFNKAVRYYADKFDVSEKELAKHIRARQSAGQKGKAVGRKYRYYLSQAYTENEANGRDYHGIEIIKASSYRNAECHFVESDTRKTMRNDYGGVFSPDFEHIIIGDKKGYATKKEAQGALKKIEQEAKINHEAD